MSNVTKNLCNSIQKLWIERMTRSRVVESRIREFQNNQPSRMTRSKRRSNSKRSLVTKRSNICHREMSVPNERTRRTKNTSKDTTSFTWPTWSWSDSYRARLYFAAPLPRFGGLVGFFSFQIKKLHRRLDPQLTVSYQTFERERRKEDFSMFAVVVVVVAAAAAAAAAAATAVPSCLSHRRGADVGCSLWSEAFFRSLSLSLPLSLSLCLSLYLPQC